MNMSKEETHILLHTLGLSHVQWYEKNKIDNPYRNNFYTSKDTTDYPCIITLIEKELMADSGTGWDKNSTYFYATDLGILEAQKIARTIIKNDLKQLTRSKKRYQLYLHCEINETFIDWLKNSYWDSYRKRHNV